MRRANAQQSASASQGASIREKILVSPWFKISILERIGVKPQNDEAIAISHIVIFILIVVFLSGYIGYLLGVQSEIPKGVEFIVSLIVVLFGFDTVKEFIGSTVHEVSVKSLKDGQTEGLEELKQTEEKIRKQYEGKTQESIQAQTDRYYLAQILKKDLEGTKALTWDDIKLMDISQLVLQEMSQVGPGFYQEELQKNLENIKTDRAIRYIVQGLPGAHFLKPLAVVAARDTLGKKDNKEMDAPPEIYFVRDIYAYLRAWLICSIDNDNGVLMPISTIGLNYPDRNNPNKEAYIKAFNYIINVLLEKEASKKILQEPALQSVKECLGKLINLINQY